jgi:hypothetical protein
MSDGGGSARVDDGGVVSSGARNTVCGDAAGPVPNSGGKIISGKSTAALCGVGAW